MAVDRKTIELVLMISNLKQIIIIEGHFNIGWAGRNGQKSEQRPPKGRAKRLSLLDRTCGGPIFLALTFWLLLGQAKSNKQKKAAVWQPFS